MANTVNCKSCGKEISATAKHCTHCGAKVKKPFYKQAWFWIIIAIVVIGISLSGESEDNASSTKTNNNSSEKIEYQKIDVDVLNDALEKNAAAAKEKYNGQYLEITGKLGTIDSDLKYFSLHSTTDEWDLNGIHCTLKSSEVKDAVKKLSKDQTIIVKGKITDVGEVLGYYLDVDEVAAK